MLCTGRRLCGGFGTDLEAVFLPQDACVQGFDGHLAWKERMKLDARYVIKLHNKSWTIKHYS